MRPALVIATLVVALLGLGLSALLDTWHYVRHLAPEAQPLDAAAVLLERHGVSSREVHGSGALFPLPDHDTLLVFDARRGPLPEDRIEAVHEWVREGGRIVIVARPLYWHAEDDGEQNEAETDDGPVVPEDRINYAVEGYDEEDLRENDPLLYSFGVSAWQTPSDDAPPPLPPSVPATWYSLSRDEIALRDCLTAPASDKGRCDVQLCGEPDLTVVYSQGWLNDALRRFEFHPAVELLHQDHFADEPEQDDPGIPPTDTRLTAAAGTAHADQLLYLTYGEGDIVVMENLHVWHNHRLHYLDHAWLLLTLAEPVSEVWFIHSVDMPSLPVWLWQQASAFLLALLALTGLYLWSRMLRRGPLLATGALASRDFLRHLLASGRFLWRHRQVGTLLHGLRQQVARRLENHFPAQASAERYTAAAQAAGLDPNLVRQAMEAHPAHEDELVSMTRTLQLLRSRL